MAKFTDRLAHAWNVFRSDTDTFSNSYPAIGSGSSYRPDKYVVTPGLERTIVNAIITRIAIDCSQIPMFEAKLDDNRNLNGGRWNKEEQFRFAEAVLKYGNDWKQIQRHVYSRNMTQVRSHAQKFLMKLKETNFMMNQKINPNLSWTKIMNYLRANFQYDELKDLFFSVEQKEEKKEEKKKIRRIINKSKKNKKKE